MDGIWADNGGYLIAACVVFFGGLAAYTGWLWSRRRQARSALERHGAARTQARA